MTQGNLNEGKHCLRALTLRNPAARRKPHRVIIAAPQRARLMTDLPPIVPSTPNRLTRAALAVLDIAGRPQAACALRSEFAIEHKSDDSPLTLADRGRIASSPAVAVADPQVPCCLKNRRNIMWPPRHQWQTLWLVDPLDGTREFVK
jgi:3'(2'), 5'-bisphosphate nucleotidase